MHGSILSKQIHCKIFLEYNFLDAFVNMAEPIAAIIKSSLSKSNGKNLEGLNATYVFINIDKNYHCLTNAKITV